MRAVNLIPVDARRGGLASARRSFGPAYVLTGILGVALLFVTIAVLTGNTISERKAKLATLQAQVARASAQAEALTSYTSFQQMAQQRAETVREIAASRFGWQATLTDLSRVVPANTSLQSLVGTVVPGSGSGGGTGTASLRGDMAGPAFELTGCTGTQDDVARLISRLRVINGVTRVSLADAQKNDTASAAGSATGHEGGCPANHPVFDLVAFFTPVPGAGPNGLAGAATPATGTTPSTGAIPTAGTQPAGTGTVSTTQPSPTTPATTSSTAAPATTTPATTTPSTTTPAAPTTGQSVPTTTGGGG